jgi:hypothetical protein
MAQKRLFAPPRHDRAIVLPDAGVNHRPQSNEVRYIELNSKNLTIKKPHWKPIRPKSKLWPL